VKSNFSATRMSLVFLVASGAVSVGLGGVANGSSAPASSGPAFLSSLGKPSQLASTVPANGDVNPYGIVVVPSTVGSLVKGDTIVSNFNNKANVQGTGTTIVQVSPTGMVSTFATIAPLPASSVCPGGIGLTTALSVLPGGWVVVGSLPAGASGALPLANPAGCLIVLNSKGGVAETWSNRDINGPWDMTDKVVGSGVDLFVSNVLSRPIGATKTPQSGDASTIVRITVTLVPGQPPKMTGSRVIGSGFISKPNKAALVQGATGVVQGSNGTLYVAETVRNQISEIPNALTRTTPFADGSSTLSSGGWLNGPLGLTLAPNGDVIVMNANDGNAVEISAQGQQVAKMTLVPKGSGDLFAAAIAPGGHGLLFVNDGTNALDIVKTK
jgi:hypothetical protein